MPAQEDTYRPQKGLHIVFALSSILMFLSIIWMMAADHLREWKKLQRDFIRLEAAKTEKETGPDKVAKEIEELETQLAQEKKAVASAVRDAQRKVNSLLGDVQKKKEQLDFKGADRVSRQSFVDIAIDEEKEEETRRLKAELKKIDEDLEKLRSEWEAKNDELKDAQNKLDKANEPVTDIEAKIAKKQKDLDRLSQKQWSFSAAFRALPVLDAFQSPTKIDQVVLNDLTIHYSFKGVPRFDRCTTCHRAIDQVTKEKTAAFDDEVLKLTDSPYKAAFKTHSRPDLFTGIESPHPREKFGCTVCHMGQGSGTSFVYASHSPNTRLQQAEWKKQYDWEVIHHWPYPMHKARFAESGCVKCHPHLVDLDCSRFGNTAPKLLKGYNLVRQYGCFGCHEITGFKDGRMIGPDLRVEPQTEDERAKAAKDPNNPPGRMRKVGPSLRGIDQKTIPEWTFRWVKLPRGFRPDTRMPQFYGLVNNDGKTEGSDPHDLDRSDVEIHAIVHYLYTKSAEYARDVKDVKNLDESEYQKLVVRRMELELKLQDFQNRADKLTEPEKKQRDQAKDELETLKYRIPLRYVREPIDLAKLEHPVTIDPTNEQQTTSGHKRFIERGCLACHSHAEVKTSEYPNATADFGPDLSNVSAKLLTPDGKPNVNWLFNWLKDPTVHHPLAFMPNLQLSDEEAADIAAWLLSVRGSWTKEPDRPELDTKTLDALVSGFVQKSMTLSKTKQVISDGMPAEEAKKLLGDEKLLEAPISTEKKLTYLGKKTISRMGCFGCHDIPGFETAKPIGTELNAWGQKARLDPDKLDFAHIVEYLEKEVPREAKNAEFELFFDAIKEHRGEGFLWQKLRNPRSYDYKKFKKPEAWDEKLRMPRFPFADRPEDVEAVMTFILGLVADDSIPQHYRNVPQNGAGLARIEGAKALDKFNCRGCHMMKMPEFTFDPAKVELPDSKSQHRDDFAEVAQDQATMTRTSPFKPGKPVTIQAMLVDADPPLEHAGKIPQSASELALDLWQPVKIDDKQFFIGDRFVLTGEAWDKSKYRLADGGTFAELLVTHLVRQGNKKLTEAWNRVPPPLVREGMKAQPAWLHQFLLNPTEIRPAVVLRMPRFNMSSEEAAALAGYFAAVDGVEYPYEFIRQREGAYLREKDGSHRDYLQDAWKLLTLAPDPKAGVSDKLCASCHNVGNRLAGGMPEERGPDLWLAPDRLRPEWLRQWITAPSRLLPYTAMPKNFPPGPPRYQEAFTGSLTEQIIAVRDALLNYHTAQQRELAARQTAQPTTGGNLK